MAISPQIAKSSGNNDLNRVIRLANIESRVAFILLASIGIPVIFELPSLLKLWLINVPENSVLFARMVIIAVLFDTMTTGLSTANLAIGKLKPFSLYVYSIKVISILVSFVFIKLGFGLESIVGGYVIGELLSSLARVVVMNHIIKMNTREIYYGLFIKTLPPVIVSSILIFLFTSVFDFDLRFLVTIPVGFILYLLNVWLYGLEADEKCYIKNICKNVKNKIARK